MNFLIFCTDQMQSYCLGCNGHPIVKTPNIDAIAQDGITFRRACTNNSVCMPSRATMVTGTTPRQHGLLTNGNCLAEDVPTVTQALADNGYRTHAVGKLHLQPFGGFKREDGSFSWEYRHLWNEGEITDLPQPYYGFQTVDYVGGHVSYAFGHYRQWLDENYPDAFGQLQKQNAYHEAGPQMYRMPIPPEAHYNNWIADRTIDFLNNIGDEDFYLFCSFPDPHHPFAACRPYSEMYNPDDLPLTETWENHEDACDFLRAVRAASPQQNVQSEEELREAMAQTYGMITHIDDNVGRVMEALKENGLYDNTVVAFLADHGEYLGSHHLMRKAPWPWEELWRVPFIWRVPGGQQQSHAVDEPVSSLDLVATIVDYADINEKYFDTRGMGDGGRPGLPGHSLRQYFDGGPTTPYPAVMEYDEDFHEGAPLCRLRGLVDGDWKLVMYAGYEDGLLFNLKDDPAEIVNLWDDPDTQTKKTELLTRLVERLAMTDRFDTRRICGA